MKVLRAKKYAKMKNHQPTIDRLEAEPEKQGSSGGAEPGKSELDNNCQVTISAFFSVQKIMHAVMQLTKSCVNCNENIIF